MFNRSMIMRLFRTAGVSLLRTVAVAVLAFCFAGAAPAASLRTVPTATMAAYGETFGVDIVADGIPPEGLGTFQFRLLVSAPGLIAGSVTDISLAQPNTISVAAPLVAGQATASRSGLGDFFWNALGAHGVLVMDNEAFLNGAARFSFSHTNGATLPSGSGTIARFLIKPGTGVTADHLSITLSDAALLNSGESFTIDSVTGADIQLRCRTTMPSLIGLSQAEALSALTVAKLSTSSVYEVDNPNGTVPLNVVSRQSVTAGTDVFCGTGIGIAVNTPPLIRVANIFEGAVYTATITPDITITDTNLAGSAITLNGNTYHQGTPVTVNGAYTLAITAQDTLGNTASLDLHFTLAKPNTPAITLSTAALVPATIGTAYSQTLAVTAGYPPYTWTIDSGVLPPGIALNSATGELSGTPTTSGIYPVTVKVADENQYGSSRAFMLSVNDIAARWVRTYDGGAADVAAGLTVDESGNAYITGHSWNGTNNDIVTVKYDQFGSVIWTKTYDSGAEDHAAGVAVDGTGNVLVAGYSSTGTANNYVTIKYDNAGNLLWSRTYEPGPSATASGVAVTADGTVYVTGSVCPAAGCDIATIAYDQDGTLAWTQNYDSGRDDIAKGVAVNATGEVFVAGYSSNGANADYVVMKFDAAGAPVWTRSYDSGYDDHAAGLAVDGSGHAVVTGTAGNSTANVHLTVKYDPEGTVVWSKMYDSGFNSTAAGIALDQLGNAYVAGSITIGNTVDYEIVKRDPSGNILWTQRYDSGNNDHAAGIAIDAIGSVHVAGYASNGPSTENYQTITYQKVGQGLAITTQVLPAAALNASYSKTLIALGGSGPYSWAIVSGPMPDGMSFNALTGEISGTATANAVSSITVRVTDAAGATAEKAYTLIAHDAPVIATVSLAPGVVGKAYNQVIAASGGSGSYAAWTVSDGTLPPGLSLLANGNAGQISGTPSQIGTYPFTVRVTDSDGLKNTKQFTITVANVTITSSQLPSGMVGFAYIETLTASGGTTPYSWSISEGSVPAGLALVAGSGTIAGTPSASGSNTFVVTVTDSGGASSSKEFTIIVNEPFGSYLQGGSHVAAKKVLFRPRAGVTMYCTVDGSNPVSSPASICTGPVLISRSLALKFFAADSSGNVGDLKTEQFVITGGGISAWGNNSSGQLGDGTSGMNRPIPVQVNGLIDVVASASGTAHTVALKKDGTVWAWGNNDFGQVGDGTSAVNRLSPVRVTGLTDIIAVAAGMSHSFALKSDGTVWAWGNNDTGQLGLGTSGGSRLEPVQIIDLSGVADIASGRSHAFALKKDGTVLAWGSNDSGQLGNGASGVNVLAPALVTGLADIVAVAGGASHSIALKNDGTVWTWGNNDAGQLGNGASGVNILAPASVNGLAEVVAIAGGASHSIALRQDGTVLVWGNNDSGQLGNDASGVNVLAPAPVTGQAEVVAIAGGASHSIALKQDGTVLAWGNNDSGQLGNGASGTNVLSPAPVNGLTNGDAVTSGNSSGYAIMPSPLTIVTTMLPNGITGATYSQNIVVSGGLAPYRWSIASGSPAPGITLNSDTGILSGTPSSGGSFIFTVQVTDSRSGTASQQLTLNIYDPLAITSTSPLANGSVGTPYSQTLAATGGRSPYTWSLATGSTNSLPAGLTLNSSTGAISGTPSASGTSSFTVQVTDADSAAATKQLSITIASPGPDLMMTSVSGPTAGATGSSITVATTARNQWHAQGS